MIGACAYPVPVERVKNGYDYIIRGGKAMGREKRKVVLVGCGMVGMSYAYAMMNQQTTSTTLRFSLPIAFPPRII